MIQIKRGKTASWRVNKVKLKAGQPGYDKDKHKIKIGDGETIWSDLPYASGLFEKEVFDSERNAKSRIAADSEDRTIITHGTSAPDKNTVGQLYLQSYDTEPEVDYVVDYGRTGIWLYRKWYSGRAECSGAFSISTAINSAFESEVLFHNNKEMKPEKYPFTFKEIPHESVSLVSTGNIVFLAGNTINTKSETGKYKLISPYKCTETADYKIAFHVSGYWR
jgi:hypothetical protein